MDSRIYARKRPCSICRRWFRPHPRLKDRQKTCGAPACKNEWHKKKCAEWNKANSDYFRSNYLQKKLDPETQTTQVKSRLKTGLPLDRVQEVIGIKNLVIVCGQEKFEQKSVNRVTDSLLVMVEGTAQIVPLHIAFDQK